MKTYSEEKETSLLDRPEIVQFCIFYEVPCVSGSIMGAEYEYHHEKTLWKRNLALPRHFASHVVSGQRHQMAIAEESTENPFYYCYAQT